MKVLVTGAGGQLGREITSLCHERGIGCSSYTSGELDITNRNKVHALVSAGSPDVIINCAAYNAVDRAEDEWKKAFLVNGIGVKNLALAANENNAVLVHYSTDYVFNGRKTRPYTIADTPDPVSRYGQSKLLGEQMAIHHADRYYLIRTSWVFGKGPSNFVKKILEWSREKTGLSVVDDQVSSPSYTADLATATLDLLSTHSYGLYHITNSGSCSRFEWAEYVLGLAGWRGKLLPAKSGDFKTAADRPAYSVLDNFGTEEVLGSSLPHWQDATNRFLKEIGVTP
jgi:dTDP-4-dehydrorhamnose reductase